MNFLIRYCLPKTTQQGEGIRYVELQAVDQQLTIYSIEEYLIALNHMD